VQPYCIDYSFDGSELRFILLANENYRNIVTLMATSFDSEGRMLTRHVQCWNKRSAAGPSTKK
jgi:hypothetical protein